MSSSEIECIFGAGLPLRYLPELRGLVGPVAAEIMVQRNECIRAIADTRESAEWLSRADLLVRYAGSLLEILQNDGECCQAAIAMDLVITLVNASSCYQEIALDTMERAYGTATASSMWSTSGSYLKRGLGLLEFALGPSLSASTSSLSLEFRFKFSKVVNEMTMEYQFLQQIGIVVLSLSKLRSRLYKDRKDAILDFQESDLKDLSTNSLMNARLVIGCLDTSLKYSNSSGSIINKPVISYLNGLIFLLLSLDLYSKDECGLSIGMIELTFAYLQQIAPKSQLNDSVISEKRRKRDILKNAFQRKTKNQSSSGTKSLKIWSKKSDTNQLLPLLKETLDDFLIHLAILLRYRYVQTNEKLTFKPVEHEESSLRRLLPRGVSSELQGAQWIFNQETMILQELSTTNLNTGTASSGYY